ncbi:unnamed protein product [Blepharisma stoltei]|uniref:Uncharacterized protein n=1 Tax=Blepharisma stoltei TaxID=1481888 RepID=A0AAU9ISL9_9CILI|nr:unnamed protein product [Blepharisma stoltei]
MSTHIQSIPFISVLKFSTPRPDSEVLCEGEYIPKTCRTKKSIETTDRDLTTKAFLPFVNKPLNVKLLKSVSVKNFSFTMKPRGSVYDSSRNIKKSGEAMRIDKNSINFSIKKKIQEFNNYKKEKSNEIEEYKRKIKETEKQKENIRNRIKNYEKIGNFIIKMVEEKNNNSEDFDNIIAMIEKIKPSNNKKQPEFNEVTAELWELFQKFEGFFKESK